MPLTVLPFTVIVPLTPPSAAKSRLAPASDSAAAHAALVSAIRADTFAAVAEAGAVRRVLVVGPPGTPLPVRRGVFVPERAPGGLNAALRLAAERCARWWPADGVAVLVGDLPALTATALDEVLAPVHDGRHFVPDRQGTGTTMLLAAPGERLDPSFGDGSAARHAEHATAIDAPAAARADVDTPADLRVAAALGLGRATASVLAARRDG